MHSLRTACKQSDSERSTSAKIPMAPGHPLPQVPTCKFRAAVIFYKHGSVKWMEPCKIANTYHEEVDNDISNRNGAQSARMAGDGTGANVDGGDELGGDRLGALVVPAATELGEDGVALVAERVEGTDDVRVGPLRDDFGDGPGEGHDTSGEDSEDGGEAHGEERRVTKRRGWRRLPLAESDWDVDERLDQSVVQVL